jgi:hypothetical protein
MEINQVREVLKELGWVRDEVFMDEGELYCHSSEYIGDPDPEPIDTVLIDAENGFELVIFSGPNWISTNSFNPKGSEERFREWMRRSREGNIDLDW